MKLTVCYKNGMMEFFDDERFTTNPLFANSNGGAATVGLTDFRVRFDDLSDGLWVEYLFYDAGAAGIMDRRSKKRRKTGRGKEASPSPNPVFQEDDAYDGPTDAFVVPIERSCHYQILDPDDLDRIAYVEADGKRVLWDCDGHLVEGVKFAVQKDLFIAADAGMSLNIQAVGVYHALKDVEEKLPGESEESFESRIAEKMGWDINSLHKFEALAERDGAWEEEGTYRAGESTNERSLLDGCGDVI